MDPSPHKRASTKKGFPRPRGDGPHPQEGNDEHETVSPPTRGWTDQLFLVVRPRVGFPAHAGMDPRHRLRRSTKRRFPRPRGDGPMNRWTLRVQPEVSPPTRGWTRLKATTTTTQTGFPAHAGMDPSDVIRRCAHMRFPRPRGDGPGPRRGPIPIPRVSPPTRGWTLRRLDCGTPRTGFPAHAGMDRFADWRPGRRLRFPRPRGDGPLPRIGTFLVFMVSPPTRGWTLLVGDRHEVAYGFPAHAGMDLCRRNLLGSGQRFPRPRGDGPSADDTGSCCATVSPPTRGRGDGPVDVGAARHIVSVSPPTRGWTEDRQNGRGTDGGFPAHAGMDPLILYVTSSQARFPRPRGDGPHGMGQAVHGREVSPPTRGWTRS